MSDSPIVLQDLHKSYGRHVALRGVDLTVRRGEVYGFIGPNGAGKSTTMRILVDVLRPSSGTVRVLGRDPRAGGADVRARIGYLPGELAMDGRSDVASWLDYQARIHRAGPGAWRPYAERLGLDPARVIGKLSRGNKQKIGLARAFAHQPELLILDEPTSGLDPLVQQEFHVMVGEAVGRGQTVFLSSHVMSELEQVAERIGVIREGRIIAEAPLDELRGTIGTRFTVQFASPVDVDALRRVGGVTDVRRHGDTVVIEHTGSPDDLLTTLATHTVSHLRAEAPDLEESVLALYRSENTEGSIR
ncbi:MULTISPECIES: ABC transporter ATP-binding protein [unclassified Ornithinimicrobium]|uniref:ABC transporter ATP-binding protein n=1 Tax=unclassified Ornithinimicrobium TaxID=2615080 RepID=UPI00385246A1